MKFKNITAGILALAGAAILSPSAHANTYTTGDLFLGFRLDGGTTDYLVDIGSYTQFTTTANFTLSLGNIGADLTSLFGAGWNTNASIHWSISGTPYDGTNSAILFATRERTNVNTVATLYKGKSNSTQSTTAGYLQTLAGGYNDVGEGATSAASTNSSVAVSQTASATNSYNAFTSDSGAYGNPDFKTWTSIEGTFKNGTAGSVLDLQQINPTNNLSATFLGSFSLDDSGDLTYIGATAVPEPSTYVMTAVGGLAMLTLLRRRKTRFAA